MDIYVPVVTSVFDDLQEIKRWDDGNESFQIPIGDAVLTELESVVECGNRYLKAQSINPDIDSVEIEILKMTLSNEQSLLDLRGCKTGEDVFDNFGGVGTKWVTLQFGRSRTALEFTRTDRVYNSGLTLEDLEKKGLRSSTEDNPPLYFVDDEDDEVEDN